MVAVDMLVVLESICTSAVVAAKHASNMLVADMLASQQPSQAMLDKIATRLRSQCCSLYTNFRSCA